MTGPVAVAINTYLKAVWRSAVSGGYRTERDRVAIRAAAVMGMETGLRIAITDVAAGRKLLQQLNEVLNDDPDVDEWSAALATNLLTAIEQEEPK